MRDKGVHLSAEEAAGGGAEKPRQGKLPGMVPKRIAEIQEAAEALQEIRTQRMELGEQEEKAQDVLVRVMKKHKVKAYRLDDEYEALIEAKERGFVRKIKARKDGKSEAGEE